MRYALLIKPHANARYSESLSKLALKELTCITSTLRDSSRPALQSLAGADFLVFESARLSDEEWKRVSSHSAVCFAAELYGGLLSPLELRPPAYLPSDFASVMKYKGKTNVDFSVMMINVALSASAFYGESAPLTVLDPLCGRGTGLFCALSMGHNAVGVEGDAKAVKELDDYVSRYLKFHRLKHSRETLSLTSRNGGSVKELRYTLSASAKDYRAGDTRTLRVLGGDTALSTGMLPEGCCHIIVTDLPYGVQHAPTAGKRVSSPEALMRGALPSYGRALKPGGAMALAMNTYTLKKSALAGIAREAGLRVPEEEPFDDFEHWVEQAVNRDVLIAVRD